MGEDRLFIGDLMSSITFTASAVASPILVANQLVQTPSLANSMPSDELYQAATVLLQAGQSDAVNHLVLCDDVNACVKGTLARALTLRKQLH